MSDNPEVVRWEAPNICIDEENDTVHMNLGAVHIPSHVDPDNAERVLAVVIELVTQMVEEDILPELLDPSEDIQDESDLALMGDQEGESIYLMDMQATAFEDGLDDFPDDDY
jgi:hypothetical protein